MRTDQFIGLPSRADNFLTEHGVRPPPCETCCRPFDMKRTECGQFEGMFGTQYPLFEYELKDGRTAKEEVQTDPWSSGPMFFLKLVISDGTEIKWDEAEINEMV